MFWSAGSNGLITAHLCFISLPKRRMYILYQAAIIWVLPVFSTIGEKLKKVSPQSHLLWGAKGGTFFPHLFWIPYIFMNSCSM